MSDIFTLKSVRFTPELGIAFKNFRIENGFAANKLISQFHKASSYFTKLEKGDIKKIDGSFLNELCNHISKSDSGLKIFLSRLSRSYESFSDETKISILNIDDLLIEHSVPLELIKEINEYLAKHKLSVQQLVNKINANESIREKDDYDYDSLPENIWFDKDSIYEHAAIRLSVPFSYVDDLLNGNISKIHRVIAHAVLYSMYSLGNEEKDPHGLTLAKLQFYKILPAKNMISLSESNIDSMISALDPDAIDAMEKVISGLKIATALAKNLGSKRIKQIAENFTGDLGFYFTYMSANLEDLEKQPKERKQEFLYKLKDLIDEYSKDDENYQLSFYDL